MLSTARAGGVLKYMLMPNLIWKPGRVAAKIRKAAVTVLLSIASLGIPRPEDLLAVKVRHPPSSYTPSHTFFGLILLKEVCTHARGQCVRILLTDHVGGAGQAVPAADVGAG